MNPYSNINFVPLDLPYAYCDPVDIKKYMDYKGKRVEYDWTKQIDHPWNHVVVRLPSLSPEQGEKPGSGWRPDFKKRFPEVVRVVEMMPYDTIQYVYLLEQVIGVEPHIDYASKNPLEQYEPATYRISLLMEDLDAFYFCSNAECSTHNIPVFPKETNSWVFSNKHFKHGSVMPKLGKRKVLLAVGGMLNDIQHFDLLEKSVAKYSQYKMVV